MGFSPPTPYSATPSEAPTWGYNNQSPQMERNNNFPPPPLLPSIHTFAQSDPEPGTSAYRAWDASAGAPYQSPDSFANSQVDPALRAPPNSDGREWSQTERYNQDTYPTPQLDNAIYTPASFAQHPPLPHPPHYSSHYPPHVHAASQQSNTNISPVRHSYTRTLVGPLSSNASRLLDEHRKPGIFFLFQDLSIRTEGGSMPDFLFSKFNMMV
jgi:Velvet factor